MSTSVRVSDLIRAYSDREKSGDFSDWAEKVELVASLQKVKSLQSFLPLFLEGAAFAVFKQLTAEQKGDYEQIKKALTTAFSVGGLEAWKMLQSRNLKAGESVDNFLSELQRLFKLAGCHPTPEPLLKNALLGGLPEGVRGQLTAMVKVEEVSLHDLLDRARAVIPMLPTAQRDGSCDQFCGAAGKLISCEYCSRSGHTAKDCWSKQRGKGRQDTSKGRSQTQHLRCYRCGAPGHFARDCCAPAPVSAPGNAGRGASSTPEASSQ